MKLTPEEFLKIEIERNLTFDNKEFVDLAKKTAKQLTEYKNLSMIDYGSGTGVYAKVLNDYGFNIKAFDIWKAHRDYMKDNYPDLSVIAKVSKFDFMIFIEVSEHMTDEQIVKAIEKIDPKFILFSSTSEKSELDFEWGHVNLKPQTEWITFWESMGYKVKQPLKYPTSWTMLLERM
jgi:2-polyprenyl-3-methyl-5-hydroxy-6-metoxy-1,4-benzoquinol methylase